MNMLRPYPQPTQLRTQLAHQYSLTQRVRFVTRPPTGRRQTRGSLIDHVWSHDACRCTRIPVLSQHSDHHAIRVQFGGMRQSRAQPVKRAWVRKWERVKSEDVAKILDEEMPVRGMRAGTTLQAFVQMEAEAEMRRRGVGGSSAPCPSPPPKEKGTPEEAENVLAGWERAWGRIKTELAPRVRITVRKESSRFPWVTEKVKAAKRLRNQLLRRAHTAEGKTAYHKAKREAERVYKESRRVYIKEHWKKAGDKPFSREHWNFLNRLMGRKSKHRVEPRSSPDAVNNAFVKKVERIRAPLLEEPMPDIGISAGIPEMHHFRWVTSEEVLKELGGVKQTHSYGVDEVPMRTLVAHRDVLSGHIARVANAVIELEWPKQWKDAEVMPLWKKKGSRDDPTKYRPIALLPAISRVVERLLGRQLKAHVRMAGIMPGFQHGFVPGRSCETAILQLVDMVASARDAGETVYVASADCSAAFDTIDHGILLQKLEHACGIKGAALSLMQSYMEGRRQRVRMSGGRASDWRGLSSGVPQGSVWGPLAFALYSADLGQYVTAARIVAYADDITLVTSHKDPAQARAQMDTALRQLEEWARRNRIAPEPTKTQVLVSSSHRKLKELRELACEMGEHNIKPSEVIKVLGVLIDEQMTWEPQCAAAARKANGAIWAVARAAQHFSVKERASLMKSLALPHLDGCQSALAGPSARALMKVRRAYNKAARTAVWGLKALYTWGKSGKQEGRLHSAPARECLHWLDWEQRRAAVRASFTAKIFHTGEPAVLRKLLPAVTAAVLHDRRMRLRSHSRGCVVSFASRKVIGEKAFSIWGPKVLNAIAKEAIYDSCPQGAPDDHEEEEKVGMGRAPPDEHAVERAAWYAGLRVQFAGRKEWHDEGGTVHVWTDGSRCKRGGIMRAGAGVFYGHGNDSNSALRVPGRQSNTRAELYAVLHVLRTEQRPTVVRSDCRYVVDGVTTWRFAWRAKAWFEKPLEGKRIPNADLWQELDRRLALRAAPFEVQWTKGHPLRSHVREQVTTELDAYGNVGSDFLAGIASGSDDPARWAWAQRVAQQPGPLVDGSEGQTFPPPASATTPPAAPSAATPAHHPPVAAAASRRRQRQAVEVPPQRTRPRPAGVQYIGIPRRLVSWHGCSAAPIPLRLPSRSVDCMCTAIPGAAAAGDRRPAVVETRPPRLGGEADPTADARVYSPAQARKEAHPPPALESGAATHPFPHSLPPTSPIHPWCGGGGASIPLHLQTATVEPHAADSETDREIHAHRAPVSTPSPRRDRCCGGGHRGARRRDAQHADAGDTIRHRRGAGRGRVVTPSPRAAHCSGGQPRRRVRLEAVTSADVANAGYEALIMLKGMVLVMLTGRVSEMLSLSRCSLFADPTQRVLTARGPSLGWGKRRPRRRAPAGAAQ
eukprot:gene37082-biopygen74340